MQHRKKEKKQTCPKQNVSSQWILGIHNIKHHNNCHFKGSIFLFYVFSLISYFKKNRRWRTQTLNETNIIFEVSMNRHKKSMTINLVIPNPPTK